MLHGDNYQNSGKIRSYLAARHFVNHAGTDKSAVIDSIKASLIGQSVKRLWRTQKIFIISGGAYSDKQGVRSIPLETSICRDGKAWYLYYRQENHVLSTIAHQWGWVARPPGIDKLGKSGYALLKISDVINSSLDSCDVAGYSHNSTTAASRNQSAIQDQ